MKDSITVRCCISGTIDTKINKEDVMRAYNCLIGAGCNEMESNFYDQLLNVVQSNMYPDMDGDIDECEISDWDREDALNFIKECIKSDGIHEDDKGQTHLFDPELYEVDEFVLECRKHEELEELKKKEG